jgi:hypothetical protein
MTEDCETGLTVRWVASNSVPDKLFAYAMEFVARASAPFVGLRVVLGETVLGVRIAFELDKGGACAVRARYVRSPRPNGSNVVRGPKTRFR